MAWTQRRPDLSVLFTVVHRGDCTAQQGCLYYEGTNTLSGCLVSNLHNVPDLALDKHKCISSFLSPSVCLACYIFHYLLYILIYSLLLSLHCPMHSSLSVYCYSIIQSPLCFSFCVCNQALLSAPVIFIYCVSAAMQICNHFIPHMQVVFNTAHSTDFTEVVSCISTNVFPACLMFSLLLGSVTAAAGYRAAEGHGWSGGHYFEVCLECSVELDRWDAHSSPKLYRVPRPGAIRGGPGGRGATSKKHRCAF